MMEKGFFLYFLLKDPAFIIHMISIWFPFKLCVEDGGYGSCQRGFFFFFSVFCLTISMVSVQSCAAGQNGCECFRKRENRIITAQSCLYPLLASSTETRKTLSREQKTLSLLDFSASICWRTLHCFCHINTNRHAVTYRSICLIPGKCKLVILCGTSQPV